MNTFPKPLSTKDEKKYLEKMKNGDEYARKVLIERNLRLVAHIVKKYNIKENDLEDIISIGTIGLIKAIDTFEIDKNYKLATYASRCIENEILMEFRNDKKISREVFIHEIVKVDSGGNNLSLFDVIECEEIDVVEKMYVKEMLYRMYSYIDKVLTSREKEVITLRYGLYGKEEMTQREIAKRLSISRSYVSRIEKRAIGKLSLEFDS